MVLQVRSGAKPTTRCAHECVYASQVQPWLESSTTRILQRKRANGCELVHTCLVGWRFRDHEDGKKQNFEAHQAAGNEHLRISCCGRSEGAYFKDEKPDDYSIITSQLLCS